MNLMTKAALNHGEYLLDAPTSIGMFEITYLAKHVPSGQTVVIKTLGNKLRQHPQFEHFKRKFKKIAMAYGRCQDPALVKVLNYFEEAGLPCLVTEYIPGQTLAQLIKIQTVTDAIALSWIRQVSEAVKVLHSGGCLHQDIKPETILRRQDTDQLVLLPPTLTEFTLKVKLKAANLPFIGYVAPEQYDFEKIPTAATDIYALAATFAVLLTGHPPLPATVRTILANSGVDEQRQLQNLEKSLKQAIIQGLELVPQKRPQTSEAWLSLLGTPKPNLSLKAKQGTIHKNQVAKARTASQQTNLAENLVTTFKIPSKTSPTAPTKNKQLPSRKKSPLRALIMTGAIATATGIGFGLALRLNSPTGAGSTLIHTEQAFPPTSNWPMSQPSANPL